MGGLSSGRFYYYGEKEVTEDYLSLDIRKWGNKLLKMGNIFTSKWYRHSKQISEIQVLVGENKVFLSYQCEEYDSIKQYNYPVKIIRTPCRYGGTRPWFSCPADGCDKRVAVLFGGSVFACRHCHNLAYKSQRENLYNRACRSADKISERLGWDSEILNGERLKPKGMHWKTFERLCHTHNKLVYFSLQEASSSFVNK